MKSPRGAGFGSGLGMALGTRTPLSWWERVGGVARQGLVRVKGMDTPLSTSADGTRGSGWSRVGNPAAAHIISWFSDDRRGTPLKLLLLGALTVLAVLFG